MGATEQQLEIRTKVSQLSNLAASIPNMDPTTQRLVTLAVSITANFWTKDVGNGATALAALDELIQDVQTQLNAARAGNPAFENRPGTSGSTSDEAPKKVQDPGTDSEAKVKNEANPRAPPPASEEIQRLIQNIRANASNDVESNPFKGSTAQEVDIILEMFMEVKDPVHLLGILRAVSAMVQGDELTAEQQAGFMLGMQMLGDKNPALDVLIKRVAESNGPKTKAPRPPAAAKVESPRQTRDASGSPRRASRNRRSPDLGKCRRRSRGTPTPRRPDACARSSGEDRRRRPETSSGGRSSRSRGTVKNESRKRRTEAKSGSRRTPRRAESKAKTSRKSRRSESEAKTPRRSRRSESPAKTSKSRRNRRSESPAKTPRRNRRSESPAKTSTSRRNRRSESPAKKSRRNRRSESPAKKTRRNRRSESPAKTSRRNRRSESSGSNRSRRSNSGGSSRRRRSESRSSRRSRSSESGTSRNRRSKSGTSGRRRGSSRK